jgi:hypothetical protein
MKLYSKVRVVKLLRPIADYDGWGLNKRAPQVGDVGTYIDILHAKNLPDHYVVEAFLGDEDESNAAPTWLSEFLVEEIEEVL